MKLCGERKLWVKDTEGEGKLYGSVVRQINHRIISEQEAFFLNGEKVWKHAVKKKERWTCFERWVTTNYTIVLRK